MALRFGRVSIYGLAFLLALACTADEKPSKLRQLVKRQATLQMQCPGYRRLMPDPADCSSYFQCENNLVTRQFCPEGAVFSPETGDCGSYNIPGCSPPIYNISFVPNQAPISYQCPRADGRFQDTSDCSRYYLCTANQPQRQQCPRDQMFDPNAQLCSDIIEPEGCHMPDINPFYPSPPRTGEPGKYQCQQSHGTYHDTTDCSKYYVCSHWQPIRRQCPWSQLFDPVTQICSSTARPIGCHMMRQGDIGTALFPCPTAYGFFQHASDCSRYWSCSKNRATSIPCPSGQLFDTNRSQCRLISFVAGCVMPPGFVPPGTQTPGFPCPTAYGSFQDVSDCSRYWSCSKNRATSTPCPPGQLFDTNRSQCGSTSFVPGCVMPPGFVSPGPQTPGFPCPTAYGSFQDSSNCSRYWSCSNNRATSTPCPPGQLFDTYRSQCGSISFVAGCVVPPGFVPPGPGTPGFLCPRPTGEFSYKEDCSQFWRCDNNQAVLRRCQGSLVFDPARGYCDWQGSLGPYPRECRLISNPGPMLGGITCPDDGFAHLVAHPRFCNAFYICGGGRVNMPCVFCGQNTYFDQRAMVCAPALSVDLTSVCLGKTMMPHFNKTMAQSQGC